MHYPENFGPLFYSEENKKRFLDTSARLLRTVGKEQNNYTTSKVIKNQGGIAVGGDVFLYLTSTKGDHQILITITHASICDNLRSDGVTCYLQFRVLGKNGNKEYWYQPHSSPNLYVPQISVDSIQRAVNQIYGDNVYLLQAA